MLFYIVIYSPFLFFTLWFVFLRPILRKKGFTSSGADYFQAFMQDVVKSFELARAGDKLILGVIFVMLATIAVFIVSATLI